MSNWNRVIALGLLLVSKLFSHPSTCRCWLVSVLASSGYSVAVTDLILSLVTFVFIWELFPCKNVSLAFDSSWIHWEIFQPVCQPWGSCLLAEDRKLWNAFTAYARTGNECYWPQEALASLASKFSSNSGFSFQQTLAGSQEKYF